MMIRVAFCCPWGMSGSRLLSGLKRSTPSGDGIWENLIGVADPYDADWLIAIEDADSNIDMSRINQNKIILCGREPPWIGGCNWDRYSTPYKFKHSLGNSYLFGVCSFPLSYRELQDIKWKPRTKKICTITSNKRICTGHHERLRFIKEFCSKHPGVLDVYGVGMVNEGLGDDYKGVSTFGDIQKLEWLSQYEYALCIENGQLNGYFTEKITDALMAHTVPIYWGAPDIDKYFSSQSFYNLDIKSPDACEDLLKIISNSVNEEVVNGIVDSRIRILTQYNWWPSIKRIIDTGRVL
jgi:hypothetical protein